MNKTLMTCVGHDARAATVPLSMIHASALPYLRNPRLAALATSREPAWVWSSDGAHVLWANAVAVKMLDAGNLALLRERRFEPTDRAAAHIVRLAASLPENGAARLERLRGFGTGFFRLLTCTCSRLTLSDGTPAILVASHEPAGPDLSLADRMRFLFDGNEEAIAAFDTDGTLVYATPAAAQRIASASTLNAFEANALATDALANGSSAGRTSVGPTILLRLGLPGNIALVASFSAQEATPTATSAPVLASAEAAPTTKPTTPAAADGASPVTPSTPPARQHPLRFVWQLDADGRFTIASDDFLNLAGPSTARIAGKSWTEINAALKLDTDDRVARAVSTRDTWSGIVLAWPIDGSSQHLKVELSGLPIYDRERNFIGYRGFGVCRDIEALTAIAAQRREAPTTVDPGPAERPNTSAAEPAAPSPAAPARPAIALVGPALNVVPFRVAAAADNKPSPGLDAGERNTFTEIARQLSTRLKNNERPQDGAAAALRSTAAPGIDGRALAVDTETDAAGAKPADRDEPPKREAAAAAKTVTADDGSPEIKHAEAGTWLAQGSDARALFDRLPLGVLVYRFDTMLYANRTFLSYVGYDSLQSFSDAGGIDSLFIEASGGPGVAGAQSLTIATGQGNEMPVEGKLFSVPWNGDNALALVLTGSKAPGQEPQKQQPKTPVHDDSELRARVQLLENELAIAKRFAETASAERSELLGRIGNDVRTPLAAIISFAEAMLNERSGPIGNERYRAYLTDIHYSGSRVLALFDELASLSKIDHTKTETDPIVPSISLNEIVQGCVAQMQAEASRARVLIRTSPGNGLPKVAAEESSIRKAVLNLLANSIRFAGAGGQVIVSTAHGSQNRVLLRLRDTGPGLSDGDLAQLRSAGSAATADQPLSLAVARALLEANHARLSVTSKSDEGTLVEVTFAAAR